jgi:lantibiotic biosynthesis protein
LLKGLTGIAWTLDHLRLHRLLDASEAGCAPRERVDRMRLEQLSEKPWRGIYEPGQGLVGYELYAAEDIEAPGHRELLEKVVDQLAATALPSNHGGVTWWTAPKNLDEEQLKHAPMGHFHIGLAHGIPSVIALLGLACALHVNEDTARKIAVKATIWLRAQQQPEGTGSYFGTIVPLGSRLKPQASRVAGATVTSGSRPRCIGPRAIWTIRHWPKKHSRSRVSPPARP